MAKSIFDELTSYRVKVERDGKEIVNVPGILALPLALAAPKASIIGTIAAPLLVARVHRRGRLDLPPVLHDRYVEKARGGHALPGVRHLGARLTAIRFICWYDWLPGMDTG